MERLDRRAIVLRGRRLAGVASELPAREPWARARAARALRFGLRQRAVVLLVHPRWSDVAGLLSDVVAELAVQAPGMRVARLPGGDGAMSRTPGAWAPVLNAIAEALGVPRDGSAGAPVARAGFRHALAAVLEEAAAQVPTRALFIPAAEGMAWEVLEDLATTWAAAPPGLGGLVLAVCAAVPRVPEGARMVMLADPCPEEAVRQIVERLGVGDISRVRGAVAQIGVLPDLVRAVCRNRRLPSPASGDPFAALGEFATPLRDAVSLARTEADVADRLEALAGASAGLPAVPADVTLERIGLVSLDRATPPRARLRTPLLEWLVRS